MRQNRAWWIGGGIGLLALATRLIYLYQAGRSPLFAVPAAEAGIHLQLAAQLSGTGTGEIAPTIWPSLLYPHLLAGIFSLSGDYSLVRWVQALMGVLNCLLLWRLGSLVWGTTAGTAAAVLAALYGPLIYFDGELVPATATVLLALALLLVLLWAEKDTAPMRFLTPGLLCGLALSTGIHMAPVALAAALWIWRREQHKSPTLAYFGLGLVLTLVPLLVFGGKAGWFAREQLHLHWQESAHNFYGFWRGLEWLPELVPYCGREESGLLAVLLWHFGAAFPFGIAAPLALVGLGFRLRADGRSRAENLLLLFIIAGALGTLFFPATAQTRLPWVMVLLPLAIVGARQLAAAQPRMQRLTGLIALVLLGLALNVETGTRQEKAQASQHYWLGQAYEKLDMKANAIREYQQAVAANAATTAPYAALGALYRERGEYEHAIGTYRDLLEHRPQQHWARRALADQYMEAGQSTAAAAAYSELLGAGIDSTVVLGHLGDALGASGDLSGARKVYRELLEVRPDSSRIRYQLARTYETEGRHTEALDAYIHLLRDPAWAVATALRLADLLIEIDRLDGRLGERKSADWWLQQELIEERDIEEVERLFEAALKIQPRSTAALWGLGKLLFWQGRNAAALSRAEQLRQLTPGDLRIYFFLSKLYNTLGRESDALEALKRYEQGKRRLEIHQRVEAEREALLQNVSRERR